MVLFGIIYSVDCPDKSDSGRWEPPAIKLWRVTEQEPDGTYTEFWGTDYHHRKYCAILTKKQFEEFLTKTHLVADSTETMGSLGAPTPDGGIHLGISPAISFDYRCDDCELNAYVTPYVVRPLQRQFGGLVSPEFVEDWDCVRANGMHERDWDRIKRAVLALWG